jgi:hypothetical protein
MRVTLVEYAAVAALGLASFVAIALLMLLRSPLGLGGLRPRRLLSRPLRSAPTCSSCRSP